MVFLGNKNVFRGETQGILRISHLQIDSGSNIQNILLRCSKVYPIKPFTEYPITVAQFITHLNVKSHVNVYYLSICSDSKDNI